MPADLPMPHSRLTIMPTMWFHVMSLSRHFFMSLSWFIRMPLFWQANRLSMEKQRLFLTFIPAVQRKSVHFCGFSPFLSSFNPLSSRGWVFYFTLQRISMKMWKRKSVKKFKHVLVGFYFGSIHVLCVLTRKNNMSATLERFYGCFRGDARQERESVKRIK